ncbi:MAG TPA: hypothetical protein VND45_06100 [Thermoanaerobaculia bacterium]|jgi:hypothetical protein|nr:hypothetical protein [Thermoanaerobaculia bacterium]
MRVTITTDGGFTGRGIGTRSADVDVDDVHPESWSEEYRGRGADLVLYTLTCGEWKVSFNETAEIPKDLRRLFERVWQ